MPYATLKVLKDNGLRLLLVGYESGSQAILNNVKKGIRLDGARQFTRDAKALGIKIHGTFIMGLPGETRETIEETIRFAQTSIPTRSRSRWPRPIPGTALYREALEQGWLGEGDLVDADGVQTGVLGYPHLSPHRDLRLGGARSTGASISGRGRSSPSAPRWCATPPSGAAASRRASSSCASCAPARVG